MTDVAALIRRARLRAGFTQRGLAAALGVSQPVIARLERSGSNPTLGTLDQVAAATGHSLTVDFGPPSGIDESMISADLRRTPAERLDHFEKFYEFSKGIGGAAVRDG